MRSELGHSLNDLRIQVHLDSMCMYIYTYRVCVCKSRILHLHGICAPRVVTLYGSPSVSVLMCMRGGVHDGCTLTPPLCRLQSKAEAMAARQSLMRHLSPSHLTPTQLTPSKLATPISGGSPLLDTGPASSGLYGHTVSPMGLALKQESERYLPRVGNPASGSAMHNPELFARGGAHRQRAKTEAAQLAYDAYRLGQTAHISNESFEAQSPSLRRANNPQC